MPATLATILIAVALSACTGIPEWPAPIFPAFNTIQSVRAKYPHWSEETVRDVVNGYVAIGMTKAMVEESMGLTLDKRVSITPQGRLEVWVYSYKRVPYAYVYFVNGKVVRMDGQI